MSPEETRARDDFAAVADAQTRALSRSVCLAAACMTVVLAPYDLVLAQTDPRAARALFVMRLALLANNAALLLALRSPRVRATPASVASGLLAVFLCGAGVGRVAGGEERWLVSIYMVPVLCGVVLLPLRHRAVFAALAVVTPLAGFALAFEGTLRAPVALQGAGLFVMAAVFGVWGGHTFYGLAREAFDLRGALDQKRAEVAEVNAALESRVEEQTRDLRRLAMRLDDVLEAERRRLARELHDDLGQELTAMRFEVEALRAVAPEERVAARVGRVASAIERAHLSVRLILESLRPRILDEEGVEASVHWLARHFRERGGCPCAARVELEEEPDAQVGLAVFRIVQEALTNVARHAEASSVEVVVRGVAGGIHLTIVDDGRGLSSRAPAARHGLIGMRERAMAVGGRLEITAVEPRGARVEATLPVQHRASQPQGAGL